MNRNGILDMIIEEVIKDGDLRSNGSDELEAAGFRDVDSERKARLKAKIGEAREMDRVNWMLS